MTLCDWRTQSLDWQPHCPGCCLRCCYRAVLQLLQCLPGLVAAGSMTGEACGWLRQEQQLCQWCCCWCLHLHDRLGDCSAISVLCLVAGQVSTTLGFSSGSIPKAVLYTGWISFELQQLLQKSDDRAVYDDSHQQVSSRNVQCSHLAAVRCEACCAAD